MVPPPTEPVAIVGGGPAGLRAAQILAEAGVAVSVYEQKASVGRKFLVAGRGGLNLTHSEPAAAFVQRYGSEISRWESLLAQFGPADVRTWAAALGVETYVGTSGRVFPRGQQAAGLLRAWVARLRSLGVAFHVGRRLESLARERSGRWRLCFRASRSAAPEDSQEVTAPAVILALGGASWPQTGSDGQWTAWLRELGVEVSPWQPANCGFEVAWNSRVTAAVAGQPLKNIVVHFAGRALAGEAMITHYGLEGGTIYQLGAALRCGVPATVTIDLKPASTEAQLLARLPRSRVPTWDEVAKAWRLGPAARALLEFCSGTNPSGLPALAAKAKGLPITLLRPRPIAEAISSAGGVAWRDLDEDLMLRVHPGLFVAGEMIDWEAPTGGYLLQGCFSTGTRAAHGVLRYLAWALTPVCKPPSA